MGRKSFRSAERGNNSKGLQDEFLRDSSTATYFVPSFSIRRHITRDSEEQLREVQADVRRELGGQFSVTAPEALSIKAFSQRQFIMQMRQADIHPTAKDMRKLAYDIRDGLTEQLRHAPETLPVPLGRLSVFGYKRQALGMEVEGWRGHKARYGSHATDGSLAPLGMLAAESRFCLDSIVEAVEEDSFDVDGILGTPHVTIARYRKDIRRNGHFLRDISDGLDDILPTEIEMGDPVIQFRSASNAEPEVLYVRNALESLAAS